MAKFVALYTPADDIEAFEEHYRAEHLPLVRAWPGVTRVGLTRFVATPRGGAAPYHLMVEVEWETDEEMAAALRSDAGVAAARDAKHMTDEFGVTITMLLGQDF